MFYGMVRLYVISIMAFLFSFLGPVLSYGHLAVMLAEEIVLCTHHLFGENCARVS